MYSYNISSFAPDGDILAANDSANGNWNYSYDQFNRLVCANLASNGTCATPPTGTPTYTYVYDRFGNRWQQNGPNSMQLTFTGNKPNNPRNNNQMDGYSYDAAGNLLNDGTHQYFYDAENHLIQVDGTLPYCTSNGASGTAATACYFYDANGHRVRDTANGGLSGGFGYSYDLSGRWVMCGTTGSSGLGACAQEIYAGSRHLFHAGGTTLYSHSDWLGTERVRTSAPYNSNNWSICESITSLPFGDGQVIVPVNGYTCYHDSTDTPHFTGKERDSESGLDNFGARFNSSNFGRFMSPDPTRLSAFIDDPQSWNHYSYAHNNPLLYLDRNGKWPTSIHNQIIDTAFPNLTPAQRQILKDVSAHQDSILSGGQGNTLAFQHAMRGPGQSVEQAQAAFDTFVSLNEDQATRTQVSFWLAGNTGYSDQALAEFAAALHAVLDSTSPAHSGFQLWDWRNPALVRRHVRAESTITPQQLQNAVSAARNAFNATFHPFSDEFDLLRITLKSDQPREVVTHRICITDENGKLVCQ